MRCDHSDDPTSGGENKIKVGLEMLFDACGAHGERGSASLYRESLDFALCGVKGQNSLVKRSSWCEAP